MALQEYPHDLLPMPILGKGRTRHVSPIQRTKMQSGRAKQRVRFTSVPSIKQVTWKMNHGQAQYFEGWLRDKVNEGTSWFLMRIRTPLGTQQHECRLTDIFEGPDEVGFMLFEYSAEIEIRERPIVDRDWILYGPEYVRFGSIFDIAMNRDWPEQ